MSISFSWPLWYLRKFCNSYQKDNFLIPSDICNRRMKIYLTFKIKLLLAVLFSVGLGFKVLVNCIWKPERYIDVLSQFNSKCGAFYCVLKWKQFSVIVFHLALCGVPGNCLTARFGKWSNSIVSTLPHEVFPAQPGSHLWSKIDS